MPPPERYWRFIDPIARARVAELAGVWDDEGMQDWPLEVADPARLGEFVDLLHGAASDDDRFALMSLVLYSADEADQASRDAAWPAIETLLLRHPELYAHEIIYWSCGDEDDAGSWRLDDLDETGGFSITPLVRVVLRRVADSIGLAIT